MGEDFVTAWRRWFPEAPPVGWGLRKAHAANWVRFHSLPGSKRYAEDDAERAIVLERANVLAEETLGVGNASWLAVPIIEEGDLFSAAQSDLLGRHGLSHAGVFEIDFGNEAFPELTPWTYYAGLTTWRPQAFDGLLLSVADDQHRAVWLNPASGAVFAPYDGGFDLFPFSNSEVERLRVKYADWLSTHPSGL